MKKFFLGLMVILIGLAFFVFNMLSSTGFFRTIENTEGFVINHSYEIWGTEDFAISRTDSFLLISADDRAAKFSDRERTAGIWMLDLKTDNAQPKLISQNFNQAFFPHGISMIQIDSSTYKVLVINHVNGQHSIEVFHLKGDALNHQQTIKDDLLFSPNDIVAIDEQRFYYTNDRLVSEGFGFFAANYLGKSNSNVGYFDGHNFSIVAEGLHYGNGINYDAERNLLYVASLRKFFVKIYQRQDDGTLNFIEDIDCKTGVDNIELDENGDLWIGCHPSLMAAKSFLQGKTDYSPSEVIHIQYNSLNDYTVESVFEDDGQQMSACSVALPFGGGIFLGNVNDKHFIMISKE